MLVKYALLTLLFYVGDVVVSVVAVVVVAAAAAAAATAAATAGCVVSNVWLDGFQQ